MPSLAKGRSTPALNRATVKSTVSSRVRKRSISACCSGRLTCDVTAADGKVTLWGTAGSAGERSRAAQVAGKVEGVKSVENKIAVVRGS